MNQETISQFDKLPPHDVEAEQCAIGSILIDRNAIPQVLMIVGREDFYLTDHQIMFDVIVKLWRAATPIDAVTLRAELLRINLFEEVGGMDYLSRLLNTVPSSAHAVHYARIVREKAMRRGMIELGNEILRANYGASSDSPVDVAADYSARLARLCSEKDQSAIMHIGAAMQETFEQLESVEPVLLRTGFRDWDNCYGGLNSGEMIIAAGRPSMGKSTLARNLAVRMSGLGSRVGYISLEESKIKVCRNMLSEACRIENNILRRGRHFIDAAGWKALADGVVALSKLPVWICDKALRMGAIRAQATMMKARYGIQVLIIDYLQKIQIEGNGRFEKVTNASLEISSMLKELDVGGIVLAQLNRQNLGREDTRPTMGDLRESGQIEQDADGIVFIHRDDYYNIADTNYVPTNIGELIFAKWRDGIRGEVIRLKTDMAYQSFDDADAATHYAPGVRGEEVPV